MKKNKLQSKTLWFNGLTILVVIATAYGYVPDQDVADTTSNLLLALSPLVNIALRFLTTQPLK